MTNKDEPSIVQLLKAAKQQSAGNWNKSGGQQNRLHYDVSPQAIGTKRSKAEKSTSRLREEAEDSPNYQKLLHKLQNGGPDGQLVSLLEESMKIIHVARDLSHIIPLRTPLEGRTNGLDNGVD